MFGVLGSAVVGAMEHLVDVPSGVLVARAAADKTGGQQGIDLDGIAMGALHRQRISSDADEVRAGGQDIGRRSNVSPGRLLPAETMLGLTSEANYKGFCGARSECIGRRQQERQSGL